MVLTKAKYMLFTSTDFLNMTGRSLDEEYRSEDVGHSSDFFITYVSLFLNTYILRFSGRRIFKKEDGLYWGISEGKSFKLNEDQEEIIKLACVYQADYFLDNGSPERMSGLSVRSGSAVLSKEDMTDYQLCDTSRDLLISGGFLYQGRGAGINAWLK